MNIVFIHAGIPIDGDSLEKGPLGGTETALIGVSRELARIPGNTVSVFTNTPSPGVYAGVHYAPLGSLAEWSQRHVADVLISIRQWVPFWLPLRSRYRVYFSPDAYDQPFLSRAFQVSFRMDDRVIPVPFFTPGQFLDRVDAVFCVGAWQAGTFVEQRGFPAAKMVVTGNAVFPERFQPLPAEQRRRACIYSATPFRGLEHLASYFPLIRQRAGNVSLDVCSGMGVYGWTADVDQASFGRLYQELTAMGAAVHGSLRQQELAALMCSSWVYTYPNTFDETFCISVLEAQCAGLPVVTSRRAALRERITDGVEGFLIDGHPKEETYRRQFIHATATLFSDRALWNRMSDAAIARARAHTYPRLAREWQDRFDQALPGLAESVGTVPSLEPFRHVSADEPRVALNIQADSQRHYLGQAFAEYGFQTAQK